MRCRVDPQLLLLRALTPGVPMALSEARAAVSLPDTAFDQTLAALSRAIPELTVTGGALHLSRPLGLMEPTRFAECLSAALRDRIAHVAFDALCESTSSEVMTLDLPATDGLNLALAEYQTAGRGRHGRTWLSGFAQGVCLTLAVRLASDARIEPAMTLAAGTHIAAALDPYLTEPVLLKWPNDLILGGGKLGGILIETAMLPDKTSIMRIGVGVNCVAPDVPASSASLAALRPAALSDFARVSLDRTALAAGLVNAVAKALDRYRAHGFAVFRDEWQSRDYLHQRPVRVIDDQRERHGTAAGIDHHGALRVETGQGTLSLMSGEVSVRPC